MSKQTDPTQAAELAAMRRVLARVTTEENAFAGPAQTMLDENSVKAPNRAAPSVVNLLCVARAHADRVLTLAYREAGQPYGDTIEGRRQWEIEMQARFLMDAGAEGIRQRQQDQALFRQAENLELN